MGCGMTNTAAMAEHRDDGDGTDGRALTYDYRGCQSPLLSSPRPSLVYIHGLCGDVIPVQRIVKGRHRSVHEQRTDIGGDGQGISPQISERIVEFHTKRILRCRSMEVERNRRHHEISGIATNRYANPGRRARSIRPHNDVFDIDNSLQDLSPMKNKGLYQNESNGIFLCSNIGSDRCLEGNSSKEN